MKKYLFQSLTIFVAVLCVLGGTVAARASSTLWPDTTVPGIADSGPDSAVELGVKFRADSSGYITGIRFYKSSANTGTHVGNLWSSSGTRLASATFTGETGSGWQQVNFSAPVSITANTVYVASYFCPFGHYSDTLNYFTSAGVDNAPLHALANGVSGVNGVYAYGSSSTFPSNGWNSSNYWVDVVFNPATSSPLSSITVTPGGQTVTSGSTQQFVATGTYSDSTIQDITSQVAWTSSSTSVATISSAGLATGVAAGSSTISAALSGVSGSTSLAVQTAPLTIATTSLPDAALGSAYSVSLPASGGNLPYSWAIAAGALPAGLTLNDSSGTISGTPTAAGSFSFTVEAADSGNPRQTATRALSITVSVQANYTIWPATTVPGLVDGGPDSPVELGVKFRSDSSGYITGIRFYKASANNGSHTGNLWTSSGTLLATATFTNESASGWQQVNFAAPVAITANTVYVASYHVNSGHYSADVNYFTGKGMDTPPLHALASGVSGSNGVYAYGSASSFPSQSWNNANYWVDVVVNTAPPAALSSLAVTPVSPAITAGSTLQFSATGIYSDGSTQNLTSQVAWASTSTTVVTISSAGLATGVAAGSSTISAALGGITGFTSLVVLPPLAITTTSLTNGVVNSAYSAALAASGGTPPYSWSIAGGTLPTGLSLNGVTGNISGTPTATGSFSFTVRAADSGNPPQTVIKSLNIVVILLDSTPPSVAVVTPSSGSTGNSVGANLSAVFSEAIDPSSINSTTFQLRSSSGTLISATVSYDSSTFIATLDPASALGYSTTYTTTITGGSSGVKDLAGNTMTKNFSWSFTTGARPSALTTPILIISSTANPFSGYYAEILRSEGLTSFDISDISAVTSTLLNSHDVVILGEMSLTSTQVTMLTNWVNAGGKLVAMRPDKKLASLLGLNDKGTTLSNGYLLVDASSGPGFGIVNQTIQYHGVADRFTLNGATALATLYSGANTATTDPAVTLKTVGTNGGQAASFTYDLARSVVYTRQGNPAWAGQDRDGISPKRSDDLFFGNASFDPQPDWIDMDKVAIPQADEQQRLLANMIVRMNMDKKPIPRFWYLPRSLVAAVVMTGDDHGNNGTSGRFDNFMSVSPAGCSVENWECIRGTSYIYPSTSIGDSQAADYTNAGFEIGAHVSSSCLDWTPITLEASFVNDLGAWRANFLDLPPPDTSRMHCVVWSDYSTMPAVELNHGIRFDTNYYYWPPGWVNDRPGMFTGSGMPMRFTNANGNIIDVYQASTQMTDESGQSYPYTVNALLDRALGLEGYYGVFTANIHTDSAESAEAAAIVNSALTRGIPVVSARQMLTWLDGRNGSSFNSISWNDSTLGFTIAAAQGATGLTAMVPVPAGLTVVDVTKDGASTAFSSAMIKGIPYARFIATSGAYQIGFAYDTRPPTVNSVTPVNGATGITTGAAAAAVFSEAMDPATVSSATIELRDSSNSSVPVTVSYNPASMTVTLTPVSALTNARTFTVTVKGGANGVKDLAGNPLASNYTWSFTTLASTGTFTIWPSTTVPSLVDAGADSPVELGVKFRSETAGYITGIRFYKASTNTGTHVANLWTSNGTRLATATFTNETASGWQQVNFSPPVSITANTVYVASYHTNTGHYSDDLNYFEGRAVDRPPLHAPADGVSGANGVYAYGTGSNFPSNGWKSSNYWVDIVFQP